MRRRNRRRSTANIKPTRAIRVRKDTPDTGILLQAGIEFGRILFGFFQVVSGNAEPEKEPVENAEPVTEDADFEIIEPKKLTNGKGTTLHID